MEGANRNADSMENTSSFTDNNNNIVPNATDVPAEAPAGSSSESRIHDSVVSIPLPPSQFYSELNVYSNIPPSWRNTGNYISGVRPALGSSSSNQLAETSENEERHSKRICLENREGESFQPSNKENDVIPTSSSSSAGIAASFPAGSSSSAGNATSSAVENPPPEAAIEFGGRVIPATPVQLFPARNPEPQPSASSSVPPTPQVMGFTTYLNSFSRQYAEWAESQRNSFQPSLMLFRRDSTSTSRQNDDNAEDGDGGGDNNEGDSDDTFDTDTDDDDIDYDDIDDFLGEEEEEAAAPGLTEEQIVNSMKIEKYTANTTTTDSSCPICWEDYKEGEVIAKLDCAHAHKFHTGCVKSWLRKHNSCPLCRMKGLVL
ncbi:uncharacterized RING finger protein P32A8.03c-like [Chenopodium quinoa]|uniref:uncharacterized RING finger protein P32A8.03c-like n=1 Tax=Chenopodium quinoa TaxID=63459 RepID=UPI000B77F4AB|nr:uncharacterized RING finger protein P32A8.03c-like [Chenopodium quinoa]